MRSLKRGLAGVGISLVLAFAFVVILALSVDDIDSRAGEKEPIPTVTKVEVKEPEVRQETQACIEFAAARHKILQELYVQQGRDTRVEQYELFQSFMRDNNGSNPDAVCGKSPKPFSDYTKERQEVEARREEDVDKLCEKAGELQYRVGRRESYSTVKRLDDEIEKEIERLGLSSYRAQWCDKVSGVYFEERGFLGQDR